MFDHISLSVIVVDVKLKECYPNTILTIDLLSRFVKTIGSKVERTGLSVLFKNLKE